MIKIFATEVKQYREENPCSMDTAEFCVGRRKALELINSNMTKEDIADVLLWLVWQAKR